MVNASKRLLAIMLSITVFISVQFVWPIKTTAYSNTGIVVAIDPGHGGEDPGSISKDVYEKDINLAVALRIENALAVPGLQVVLTRRSDCDYIIHRRLRGGKTRKQSDLDQRLRIINENNADILISLHVNCIRKRFAGAEVFYNPRSEQSKLLGQYIQQELRSIPGMTKRIAKEGDYYIINKTEIPSVIIEMGYLSDPSEKQLLVSSQYQDQMARAISEGILKYLINRNG